MTKRTPKKDDHLQPPKPSLKTEAASELAPTKRVPAAWLQAWQQLESPLPEQRAAELHAEREKLHSQSLRKVEALSWFLLSTRLTEKETEAIVYDCDLPWHVGAVLEQQIAFVVGNEKARKLIPQGVTADQLTTTAALVRVELYNHLAQNLRPVLAYLLVINFFDKLGRLDSRFIPPESIVQKMKMAVMSQLFKSKVKRRKGSGRPRKTTTSALMRDVKKAAKRAKQKGRSLTLNNVAAEMGQKGKTLGETLRNYKLDWKSLKKSGIVGK